MKMSKEKRQSVSELTEAGALALATIGFTAFVFVSGLANSPNADHYGFKNSTTAVSDEFVTQVTPAGFTFAIWAFIYLWQFAWLGYAWTFICRPEAPRTISIVVYTLFAINSVLNTLWLYLFGNKLVNLSSAILAAIEIVIYLTIIVMAYYFYQNSSVASQTDDKLTRVLILNGLSFFGAWITIANQLNLSIVLQYTFGFDAALVGTVALTLLGADVVIYFILENTVLVRYSRDVFAIYPVVIWALIGVLAKHWGKPGEGRNSVYALVLLLGTVVLMLLRIGLFIILSHFQRRKGKAQTKYSQLKSQI